MQEPDFDNMPALEPKDIAEMIFTGDPKPKLSYQGFVEEADHEYVFELMIHILMEGIKFKYGEALEISEIKIEDIPKLQQYMESMGFGFKIEMDNIDDYVEQRQSEVDIELLDLQIQIDNYKSGIEKMNTIISEYDPKTDNSKINIFEKAIELKQQKIKDIEEKIILLQKFDTESFKYEFRETANEKYYCIVKKNDYPDYFMEYSGLSNTKQPYRYILNGHERDFKEQQLREKLNDYFALFYSKDKNYKYRVKFNTVL